MSATRSIVSSPPYSTKRFAVQYGLHPPVGTQAMKLLLKSRVYAKLLTRPITQRFQTYIVRRDAPVAALWRIC